MSWARRSSLGWLAIGCVLGAAFVPHVAAEPAPIVFPLRVHHGGVHAPATAADDAWLAAQIDTANGVFGPHGVSFRVNAGVPLEDGLAVIHSYRDLDALTQYLHASSI